LKTVRSFRSVIWFDDRIISINGFYYFFDRLIPLKYSFVLWVFRAKPLYFFEMFLNIELLIVVVVFGFGAGDIIRE